MSDIVGHSRTCPNHNNQHAILMLNQHRFGITFFLRRLFMKKDIRFSFLVTLVEKRALERLAEVNDESQASYLRRLIQKAATGYGLEKIEERLLDNHIRGTK